MPYTISRTQKFEYAHRLMYHEGPCRFIHGHSGEATVVLCADKLQPKQCMVMDFADVKRVMSILLDKWDHAVLLHTHDEFVGVFKDKGMKVYEFGTQPTAEIMAEVLYKHMEKYFPGRVESVTISETEKNKATYRR